MDKRGQSGILGFVVIAVLFGTVSGLPSYCEGTDWLGWRGPDRMGVSSETGWLATFPEEGPKQIWKASVGLGCSSVSVKGNRVLTMGNQNDVDTVYCLDARTGNPIWKYTYNCPTAADQFEGGPGATPTIDGDRVYTFSRSGHLFCFDLNTGKVIWSKQAMKDWSAERPTWGFACSPLILGDKVLMAADSVLAFEKATGKIIWKTEKIGANYSSPVEFNYQGKSCIAIFCPAGLIVFETVTGKEVLRHPWKTSYDVNAATPIILGNEIFVSSGYNRGCSLILLEGNKATTVWENKNMRNHFNSCVFWKGYLYGFDEQDLKCIEKETGRVMWSKRGLGKGSLMIADDKLIIQSERGVLAIAEATPNAYQEISSAQVLDGRCWIVPVLSNKRLYCRNNVGDMVCLDVSVSPQPVQQGMQ